MKAPVISFRKVENVGTIYKVLNENSYNGFPVVNRLGQVRGLILRSQLITLLMKKNFQATQLKRKKFYEKVSWEDFKSDYPRFPPIASVKLTQEEKSCYLDLTHFMHLTPHTVHYNATLLRVFQIFRTMGLRHLLVVKGSNKVVGIITRKDLACAEEQRLPREKQRLVEISTSDSSSEEDDAARWTASMDVDVVTTQSTIQI
eukprot:TRINITY_DN15824_c0_g1_i3.p1 TRINITY_DN15824_c0_g1~~TRINITY_DN15824_c0_g1_i3.p1  ORF type:complete len:202 (-),score=43.84 TRINITY_DN15824_c0_g1_i3:126-731(-)